MTVEITEVKAKTKEVPSGETAQPVSREQPASVSRDETQSSEQPVQQESKEEPAQSEVAGPSVEHQPLAEAATAEEPSSSESGLPLITRIELENFLAMLPKDEWESIQANVRVKRGDTSPSSKGQQTRNLERVSVPTALGVEVKDAEAQTSRLTSTVLHTHDGFLVSFPDGSSMDLHGPFWLSHFRGPVDE